MNFWITKPILNDIVPNCAVYACTGQHICTSFSDNHCEIGDFDCQTGVFTKTCLWLGNGCGEPYYSGCNPFNCFCFSCDAPQPQPRYTQPCTFNCDYPIFTCPTGFVCNGIYNPEP